MNISTDDIIKFFPIKKPYCFIDEILSVDETRIVGSYRFSQDEFFYAGHFPGFSVTPGAILSEAAAQVGLLAFGMYLLGNGLVRLSEIPEDLLPSGMKSLPKMSDILSWNEGEIPSGLPRDALENLFFLSSSDMTYKRFVEPGEKIIIQAEKVFFKFNKLKCDVQVLTEQDEVICKGMISGIVVKNRI